MPDRAKRETTETLGGAGAVEVLGLRFDEARYAEVPSGSGMWVVPGKAVMCLVRAEKIATSCDTRTRAAQMGMLLQVYKLGKPPRSKPTQFQAIGVAPDGARKVLVKAGPQSAMLSVVDNTYDYKAKTPIRIVRFIR